MRIWKQKQFEAKKIQTQFMTRYSFFGTSDWRSNASKDAERLFVPSRLAQRKALFERIALQSLRDQSDQDFELLVLSSEMMPDVYKKRLSELCNDMLGDRAHVIYRAPRRVAGSFHDYRSGTLRDTKGVAIQTILDDDDGVSTSFVARIKREAKAAQQSFQSKKDYVFISHASGVNLKLSKEGSAEITKRSMPCTAQGLTLVAPVASHRSPFNIAHKKILQRRPVRVLHGGPAMYVRTVHSLNDSRGIVGNDLVAPEALSTIVQNDLPLLAQFLPQQQDCAPLAA